MEPTACPAGPGSSTHEHQNPRFVEFGEYVKSGILTFSFYRKGDQLSSQKERDVSSHSQEGQARQRSCLHSWVGSLSIHSFMLALGAEEGSSPSPLLLRTKEKRAGSALETR